MRLTAALCSLVGPGLLGLIAGRLPALLALLSLLGKEVLVQILALLAGHDAAGVHEAGEVAKESEHD